MKKLNLFPRQHKIRINAKKIIHKIEEQIAPKGYIAPEPHPNLRSRNLFKCAVALLSEPLANAETIETLKNKWKNKSTNEWKNNPTGEWTSEAEIETSIENDFIELTPMLEYEFDNSPKSIAEKDFILSLMQFSESMQLPNGHFRRTWSDKKVKDFNTVEFCMRDAGILYKNCQDKLLHYPKARQALRRIFAKSLSACQKRKPPTKYTNIALMNALNLMVLGDILNNQEAVQEGIKRFKQFALYTWEWGIHENLTRVYTSIQKDCLGLIRDYGPNEDVKKMAERLTLLTFANAATSDPNSLKANQPLQTIPEATPKEILPQKQTTSKQTKKLNTEQNRETNPSDTNPINDIKDIFKDMQPDILGFFRIMPAEKNDTSLNLLFKHAKRDITFLVSNNTIFKNHGDWDQQLESLLQNFTLPRLVRASWGPKKSESRTHFVTPNISLMSLGARYDFPKNSDIPLIVNFSNDAENLSDPLSDNTPSHPSPLLPLFSPNTGYLLPGIAETPYNRKSKRHDQALWTAVQTKKDVLALALYKPQAHKKLETSFVLPLGSKIEFFKNDTRIDEISNTDTASLTNPYNVVFAPNDTLTLQYDDKTAVAIKIPWARNLKGENAFMALHYDNEEIEVRLPKEKEPPFTAKNKRIPAIRLTVYHHLITDIDNKTNAWANAGAAFWVRIKSSDDATPMDQWRQTFQNTPCNIENDLPQAATLRHGPSLGLRTLRLRAQDETNNPLCIDARTTNGKRFDAKLTPPPSQAILEINGQEAGRRLLENEKIIEKYEQTLDDIYEPDNYIHIPSKWEAEDGRIQAPFVTSPSNSASKKQFTRKPGRKGSDTGNLAYCLKVDQPDPHYLWARIRTPHSNKFILRICHEKDSTNNIVPLDKRYLVQDIWRVSPTQKWKWVRIIPNAIAQSVASSAITLPQGIIKLQLFARKAGVQIDQFYITTNATQKP